MHTRRVPSLNPDSAVPRSRQPGPSVGITRLDDDGRARPLTTHLSELDTSHQFSLQTHPGRSLFPAFLFLGHRCDHLGSSSSPTWAPASCHLQGHQHSLTACSRRERTGDKTAVVHSEEPDLLRSTIKSHLVSSNPTHLPRRLTPFRPPTPTLNKPYPARHCTIGKTRMMAPSRKYKDSKRATTYDDEDNDVSTASEPEAPTTRRATAKSAPAVNKAPASGKGKNAAAVRPGDDSGSETASALEDEAAAATKKGKLPVRGKQKEAVDVDDDATLSPTPSPDSKRTETASSKKAVVEDSDATESPPSSPIQKPKATSNKSKTTDSDKDRATSSRSPSPRPPKKSAKSTKRKASADEDDDDTPSPLPSPSPNGSPSPSRSPSPLPSGSPSPEPSAHTKKSGRIGGLKGAARGSSSPGGGSSPSAQPRVRKLGGIGHGHKSGSSQVVPESSQPGDAAAPAVEEKVEETVEEKADRRRAELKKTLESKALKGPVKKKRRL